MFRFCAGETRPNTACSRTASASCGPSSGRAEASTASPCRSTPAWRAAAATVAGLSPEITFAAMPCWVKNSRVSRASVRTCSRKVTSSTGSWSPGSSWPGFPSRPRARACARESTRVRSPDAASSRARARAAS